MVEKLVIYGMVVVVVMGLLVGVLVRVVFRCRSTSEG